jgi:hypothetical protein
VFGAPFSLLGEGMGDEGLGQSIQELEFLGEMISLQERNHLS